MEETVHHRIGIEAIKTCIVVRDIEFVFPTLYPFVRLIARTLEQILYARHETFLEP